MEKRVVRSARRARARSAKEGEREGGEEEEGDGAGDQGGAGADEGKGAKGEGCSGNEGGRSNCNREEQLKVDGTLDSLDDGARPRQVCARAGDRLMRRHMVRRLPRRQRLGRGKRGGGRE